MAALARGLAPEVEDRKAVLEQLERPEHYLGVLWLTSLPEGRGGSQPLPVARDYRGLAVFENLRNAYSGSDGVQALQRCVQQFAQIYVNHARPLRLALVNPPNASQMLLTLLKDSRRRRSLGVPLLVDIYATQDHEARLVSARRFSSDDRDQIEEYIANGRLRLRVHDHVTSLEERLRSFHDRPVHILAVFDEATTGMRQQPGGINPLPMSPFAIRRRIAFQGIRGEVELLPSMDESVFRSFYDMQGKLDAQSGQTPQASADAEQMRGHIESVLTDDRPGAFWFFFADRALPSPGGTRVARILERRDGRRRSVCYDASYERLALLLRQPLDQFNLRFTPQRLQELLEEGVILLGDGLIDLFGVDGQPDSSRVLGFAGMLIAARDYKARPSRGAPGLRRYPSRAPVAAPVRYRRALRPPGTAPRGRHDGRRGNRGEDHRHRRRSRGTGRHRQGHQSARVLARRHPLGPGERRRTCAAGRPAPGDAQGSVRVRLPGARGQPRGSGTLGRVAAGAVRRDRGDQRDSAARHGLRRRTQPQRSTGGGAAGRLAPCHRPAPGPGSANPGAAFAGPITDAAGNR